MSSASLNGAACTGARVHVPAWGVWWADVDLVGAVTVEGAASLVIGGVTLAGTIISGGASNGRSGYRIAGGKGGWGRTIAAKGYADDVGVKASTVLKDAAAATGETLGALPTTRVGPHFARSNVAASHVLHAVAPRNWYVDFAGVTQIGQRPASTYAGAAPRTRVDPAVGVIDLATDEFKGLVPGVSVDGAPPAADVEYILEGDRLTARMYSRVALPRRLAALAKIFDALDPRRAYRAAYEYRVVDQVDDRFEVQIVRVSTGMPDLSRVPVRPGMAGHRADVQLGELVLVTFVDGDPARPCITSHDAPDAPGWEPRLIEFGTATDYFAHAAKVGTEIQRLRTWADAHVHPTGVGPSGAPTPLTSAHSSVACAKVKGE